MMDDEPSVAELVGSLMRTLNHELRTPLSVISNELHCISSTLKSQGIDTSECDRALRRCKEMSALLSRVGLLSGSALRSEAVDLGTLDIRARGEIFSDASRVHELGIVIGKLLGFVSAAQPTLSQDVALHKVSWSIPDDSRSFDGVCRDSCFRFFAPVEAATIEAVLADVLIYSLGVQCKIQGENGDVTFTLVFKGPPPQ